MRTLQKRLPWGGTGKFPLPIRDTPIILLGMVLEQMTRQEKWQTMETLWEDLRHDFEEDMEVSPQVRTMLEERRAAYERGEVRLLEWDEAMTLLQRRLAP